MARLRRTPVIVASVIVVAVVAVSWPLNLLDVRARSPLASVASAFDPAPDYPGYRWSSDGRDVESTELTTIAGPSHCGWQSATMLFIGWPPGTRAATSAGSRMYVRDPHGAYSTTYRDRLVLHATLPADARSTGYRLGPIELYLSPTDQDDAIYVVAPSGTERWPRVDPMGLCA
jgi:hypothetical protein